MQKKQKDKQNTSRGISKEGKGAATESAKKSRLTNKLRGGSEDPLTKCDVMYLALVFLGIAIAIGANIPADDVFAITLGEIAAAVAGIAGTLLVKRNEKAHVQKKGQK